MFFFSKKFTFQADSLAADSLAAGLLFSLSKTRCTCKKRDRLSFQHRGNILLSHLEEIVESGAWGHHTTGCSECFQPIHG